MPKCMNKTVSLTIKCIETLEELCKESNKGGSMLFRAFIKYFKVNPKEFQKIKNGDYDS